MTEHDKNPAEFPRGNDPLERVETVNPRTEELAELVERVMSTHDMRLRSNIPERLLTPLIRLDVYGQEYDCQLATDIANWIRQERVSIKGWGMGNLIKALQALRPAFRDDMQSGGSGRNGNRFDRMLGRS